MSFHHRVTQSITEFYSFDFKLIKLCETLCPVVKRFITLQKEIQRYPLFLPCPISAVSPSYVDTLSVCFAG
ncbi:hypothetical protein HMPREF1062_01926 [Bacteroides cellulosilyticus CL02T12C19]|jgi:hypothetical protein|uniref:Uncharacterized protein n=1 Tax=Bacteroides cellulosilyticus CL02T12C19 TaxID=997874 RepID=I8W601_9BACE|nr:hypothetical protein HMPREF1062_01926 [Bacteroides cellulosilyticus CL02T12C19]